MSRLNNGMERESDLLSCALLDIGLDLNPHESISSNGNVRPTGGEIDFPGASLSLSSTTNPNDLLDWSYLLSNTNGNSFTTNHDDDLSSFLEPFNQSTRASHFTSGTGVHNGPYISNLRETVLNKDGYTPLTATLRTNAAVDCSLRDLLSTDNDLGGSLAVKPAVSVVDVNKDISRKVAVQKLWANEDMKLSDVKESTVDDDEEEDDELGYSDTYAQYWPSKLKIGKSHPDSVVETSSLSSVAPPDVWYRLAIPKEVIDKHFLSALQLEAIVYACQRHEVILGDGSRAGFLIGDGAGVGKGRTVAGIISENYLLGRKRALWLSVSNDLKYDAVRDLRDINCNVNVRTLNKFKYDAKLSSSENGSFKKGVLFATYSSLIGESQGSSKYRTRLSQIVKWCGSDFDGVIVLDECHKAKNLVPTGSSKPTKTGKSVLELQEMLPKARVVYCSATGASEPKNMAYMSRLGIWGKGTPFKEFGQFIQAVEKRGVGAMELVAMDMKLRGMYMARQLSFAGVTFDIKEVPLSEKFIQMYNASAILWEQAREKFALALTLAPDQAKIGKKLWAQFWASHQRFFKYLCIASKVEAVVAIAQEAIKNGKCVVIGLQSTGEARTLEQLGENGELNEFVSTAKGVFQALIEKRFPVANNKGRFVEDDFPKLSQVGKKRKSVRDLHKTRDKKFKKDDVFGRTFFSDNDDDISSVDDDNDNASLNNDSKSCDSNDDENGDDVIEIDSESDSDEDNWLKKIEKPKKKKRMRNGEHSSQTANNMEVLRAAGLHVNSLNWSKPSRDSSSTAVKAAPIAKNSGSSTSFDDVFAKLEAAEKKNDNMNLSLVDYIKTTSLTSEHYKNITPAEQCQVMKTELLHKLDYIASYLPNNTLDKLMNDLGGPDKVAEMTGRKGRVVSGKDGSVQYELRNERDVRLEMLNIAEKTRFMNGEKNVAIISEAASSGISLQADRRAKNQKRRVHITLELPWSADKAIQQFGRTHRSNQVNAPEYLFLISKLSGEQRFASIVAKRLESLGALTHGDRRATESRDLSKYNFDNKYGRTALEFVLKSVVGLESPIVKPPSDYQGDFFADVRVGLIGVGLVGANGILDKDSFNISKFLNRLLGLQVALQNGLFQYFTDTLEAVIQKAKRNGRYDEGILDLGSNGEAVHRLSTRTFENVDASGSTELHTVSVERGLSWEQAQVKLQENEMADEGFYLSKQVRNNKRTAILVKQVYNFGKKRLFRVYRPNTGMQSKMETLPDIQKKYDKVAIWTAEPAWIEQYESSETQCTHSYWKGNCKRKVLGLSCVVGLRTCTYHILSGSVLRVWDIVEDVLSTQGGNNSRMQIIRVRTMDGLRVVGSSIPTNCVEALSTRLSSSTANE